MMTMDTVRHTVTQTLVVLATLAVVIAVGAVVVGIAKTSPTKTQPHQSAAYTHCMQTLAPQTPYQRHTARIACSVELGH
jgi:hypothetical protein